MALSLSDRFALAGGSSLGRAHARSHRNNQDAFALSASRDVLLAVVADGCSGGHASEVGARIATTWVAAHGPSIARATPTAAAVADALTSGLREAIDGVVRALAPATEDRAAVVGDLFLFTLLVAIVTADGAMIVGLGDGMFSVNGRSVVLDAGEANAPPYLAYSLVEARRDRETPSDFRLRVLATSPADALASIAIATDGACALDDPPSDAELDTGASITGCASAATASSFAEVTGDPRYGANASLLQKRLTALASTDRRLQDDVTIAVIRRRSGS